MSGYFIENLFKTLNMSENKKIFMPVKEFADKKKVSVQHVYNQIREGKLETKKIGSYTLVRA